MPIKVEFARPLHGMKIRVAAPLLVREKVPAPWWNLYRRFRPEYRLVPKEKLRDGEIVMMDGEMIMNQKTANAVRAMSKEMKS